MKISILYGTQTGNAEMLADDIQSALEADHEVACADLAETEPASLTGEEFVIIVCSTYGDGELPASAQPFVAKLEAGAFDLTNVRFAVFGLGDSEYADTFAFGSKKIAEKLVACGAVQVGPRLTHDASGGDMAEEVALPWVETIIQEMTENV
ncbi:flavodoxin domain-containing protein [Pseudorhizobium sp. NPDC055634]